MNEYTFVSENLTINGVGCFKPFWIVINVKIQQEYQNINGWNMRKNYHKKINNCVIIYLRILWNSIIIKLVVRIDVNVVWHYIFDICNIDIIQFVIYIL